MVKHRIMCLFFAALLCCMMILPAAFATTYGTVHGGWLRLRAEPSRHAETIASYPSGSVVTVLSQANGWCHVKTADYRVGYMMKKYLIINTDTPAPGRIWTTVNQTARIVSANGQGVRLRSAPEVNSNNVLGLYPVGRTVMVYKSSNDGWSYIKIDRKYGYMMSEFLTTGMIDGMLPVNPASNNMPIVSPGSSGILSSAALNITQPSVGDTLAVSVFPSTATYTVIWYRDDNQLLSTGSYYSVRESDAGHIIHVRINGVGPSNGIVLTVSTGIITAGSSFPSDDEDVTSWMH